MTAAVIDHINITRTIEAVILGMLHGQDLPLNPQSTYIKPFNTADVDAYEASAGISARGKRLNIGLKLFYDTPQTSPIDLSRYALATIHNIHDFYAEIANQIIGRIKGSLEEIERTTKISLPVTTFWGSDDFSKPNNPARRYAYSGSWLVENRPVNLSFACQLVIDTDPAKLAKIGLDPAKVNDKAKTIEFF